MFKKLLSLLIALLLVCAVLGTASAVLAEDAPDDGAVLTVGASDGSAEADGDSGEKTDNSSAILALIGGAIALVFVGAVIVPGLVRKNSPKITVQQLTESALMIAIATVCSIVKFDLPFGGGVTVVSMLPIILISHRYGWRWGVATAFVYSLIQLVLGLDNVGYATSTFMAFGVISLDYIVAYTFIGLSGVFGKSRKAVIIGICVTFFLRFACHYVTGVWIWKEWMPEEFMGWAMKSPFIYSALYNGWYMLVELAIHLIVAMLIYKPLKGYFTGEK